MPRYFLDLKNDQGGARDAEGVDLADQKAARCLAIEGIRGIVAEEALRGKIDLRGHIDIANAERDDLLRVAFTEAFEVKCPGSG